MDSSSMDKQDTESVEDGPAQSEILAACEENTQSEKLSTFEDNNYATAAASEESMQVF